MSILTERFGANLGAHRSTAEEKFNISLNLRDAGQDLSTGTFDIQANGVPKVSELYLDRGGLTPENATTQQGVAIASAAIRGFSSFRLQKGLRLLVRHKDATWEWWMGASWRALPNTVAHESRRTYSTIVDNILVVANGKSRLKKWDGVHLTGPDDLSDEAPYARFVTRIGRRLFVAVIRPSAGEDPDPYAYAYSADGDSAEWTDVLLGAGGGNLTPEGPSDSGNFITGLSGFGNTVVMYRERSIALGLRTGLAANPFQFTHVDFSKGTLSPYSIAAGGIGQGDCYLGFDKMPYLFTGRQSVPIGEPIFDELQSATFVQEDVVGFIDIDRMEYWLCLFDLNKAYVFSLRSYFTRQQLVWRTVTFAANTVTAHHAFEVNTSEEPFVDDIATIINNDTNIVDPPLPANENRIVLGNATGETWFFDPSISGVATAEYVSKVLSMAHKDINIEKVSLHHTAPGAATVTVEISTDGGTTWSSPVTHTVAANVDTELQSEGWHDITGRQALIRIKWPTGRAVIKKIDIEGSVRGLSSLGIGVAGPV